MENDKNLFITVGSGETVSGITWDDGENITVSSGGTVADITVTHRAAGMTFQEGATLSGTISTAAPVTFEGDVNAEGATLVWDISRLKKESDILWNDFVPVSEAEALLLNVNINQDKGTYRLAGNAAGFDGIVTVTNSSGVVLGTLSLDSAILDFDVTRYTLALNEANELTVTISSNITDEASYVFLYKNNQLIQHHKELFGVELSADGEFDHLVIIEGGHAGNIKIASGSVVTVYNNAFAAAIEQSANGKLRFDYTAGDETIITGVNQYGSFFVQNDSLFNVQGENVNLYGDLTVIDYHSNGVFTAGDGVDISGVFVSGSSSTFKKGTTIHDCSITGNYIYFESGITVTDTTIGNGSYHYYRGGDYSGVTISGNNSYFYGGYYDDITITSGGSIYGVFTLTGTLTLQSTLNFYGGFIDAAGNTVVLDYSKLNTLSPALVDGAYVSEDALFCINFSNDHEIGIYNLLGSGDLRTKYSFSIRVGGDIVGTLTQDNTSFDNGNYIYTITEDKKLQVEVSPNADETFGVLFWRQDGTVGHTAELFTATTDTNSYKHILVRHNGTAGDIRLAQGGLLELNPGGVAVGVEQRDNAALRFNYTAGDETIITGINQYGTFFVSNDLLINVVGEAVTLSGKISVQDYRATGKLTATGGVSFTGILDTGSQKADLSGVMIADAAISGSKSFHDGVSVTNSTISGSTDFRGGAYTDVSVSGSVYFYGGTFSDSVWYSGILCKAVELAGTLTVKGNISTWGGVINANNNTIVLDYTDRTVTSGAMIALTAVSEEVVFDIALRDDQTTGTYTIASQAGSFIDTFNITIGGDVIGTLTNENSSFEYGNFSYSMGWDNITQNITLTIGISENADERFNVLCYNSANELFYAKEMTDIVVDGTDCAQITVRNGGWLANTKLNQGTIAVRKGANIYGLEQSTSGKLRFDYAAGDDTMISGVNQYGTFLVKDDRLVNVAGENVNISGNVTIEEYHSAGSFNGTGVTVKGNFYGNGSFKDAVISKADFTGSVTVSGNSLVTDSTFNGATFSGGIFETVTVNGPATLSGGSYYDLILNGTTSIRGRISLDGALTIANTTTCVSNYSVNGAINANGYEVNLDLTSRSPVSGALINLDRVYNADLTVTVYSNQTIGTYTLGTNAGAFAQGDGKGYWDIDTNTWLYKNAVQGDLDGVVTIRSYDGIELVRCTVNGDTEYFGRYNYRIYTDENDQLQLRIGWNNKGDVTFTDDGYDNDTFDSATVISGSGEQTLSGLTIHNDSDVDFYKFTLEHSGTAASNISISFKQWAGDLEINLYDAAGNLINYAHSVTDNEIISLQGLAAGDYYIKVFGDNGDTNGYTLTANLPVKPDFNDKYEKGDTQKDAYHLGTISSSSRFSGAITEAGDNDYFTFTLDRSGTAADSITLSFDPELGDLDLYLYDAKGKNLLGKAVSTATDSETLTFKGLSKGTYTVKVVAKNSTDIADYKLDFGIRSKEVDPDKYENNNTLKKAKNLNSLNGKDKSKGLTIHSADDVDYFKFKLKEDGSADDYIAIDYDVAFGDIDIEILDEDGNVVAFSRTAENNDTVSLERLSAGNYYFKVYGYNGVTNTYDVSWNITNSGLIASDSYEGHEMVQITQNQKITGLTIAAPKEKDETRADVFTIQLGYDAWKSSKIILSDFRADWEEGMAWKISTDPEGKNVISSDTGSEISLYGLKKGTYYLTVDAPKDNQYSTYSIIAQDIPDSAAAPEKNSWSIFIYLAGDNNLEGSYLNELRWMQQAVLPEGVEVYVLMDRSEEYSVTERNWSDTRVGKIVHSPGSAVAVQWLYFDGENTDTRVNTSNLELRQEWDTGDVATLEAFLDWGMKTGRADNYALIMKDHGTSLGYNSSDETSGSIMNIADIASLLDQSKYDDLKVVAFDQCLMGSDVVISTMEGNVDYVVASEAVGWTPNLLVMYKVLFNSLSADMTPQELAQKIVKACNCSGIKDLTLASFDVSDNSLSEALNTFAATASKFTRADWVEVCKAFALAYNYGDDICAFSDLGFILSEIIKSEDNISQTLLDAAETLKQTVLNDVIDATMITPASYGSGFAVFNPVQSYELMSFYSYGPGANLDYYGTEIGESAWGEFLYTVGQLAEDCTEYFVDNRSQLTFTDYTYSFFDESVQVNYNLGAFYGDGVEYNGLYIDDELYFTITLDNTGVAGDLIRVTADNPDAEITMMLVQQRPTLLGMELITRRVSEDGVLSLAGIDNDNAGVLTEYFLTISTNEETTIDLSFEADWTSGSDYFDYSRSGNQPGKQGNGSTEKATVLSAGRYGGLVTHQNDADYYKLSTVYSNEIDVTVTGSGLTVREYDEKGKLVRSATQNGDRHTITIANGNYLYVIGDGTLEAGKVNSYSMEISDFAHTYLAPEGGAAALPELSVKQSSTDSAREAVITPEVAEGLKTFVSTDLQDWSEFSGAYTATENNCYYFKAVDQKTGLESKYTSVIVSGIDNIAPEKPAVQEDITTLTRGNVVVTAIFSEDSASKEFSTDGSVWQGYTAPIVMEQNGKLYFRAADSAGNISEITEIEISNIDKVAPTLEISGNATAWTNSDVVLTANVSDGTIEYYNGSEWVAGDTLTATENGTYTFRVTDAAGNVTEESVVVDKIDKAAPDAPETFTANVDKYEVKLDWENIGDKGASGTVGYYIRYGTSSALSGEGTFVTASGFILTDLPVGSYCYQVKTLDNAGNTSAWSALQSFEVVPGAVQGLQGSSSGLSWDAIPGAAGYIVEYSKDNFVNVMTLQTTGNHVDSFALPAGTYQWRVKAIAGEFVNGKNIISNNTTAAHGWISDTDGNMDLFFGRANGRWGIAYSAQNAESGEVVSLNGKNRIQDVFTGSTDANVLVLTDDSNGDALFIDDVYSALGTQARLSRIDEIRAGAGNDIIDLTSDKYAFAGNKVTICGGAGNDTIWANSEDDFIIGGSGNDSLFGGGGNDTFIFGENWGKDTVEQLASGKVTLLFENGSVDNWNAETGIYSDGVNSVTVTGTADITLKFGNDATLPAGVFAGTANEKIFEDKDKGMLA